MNRVKTFIHWELTRHHLFPLPPGSIRPAQLALKPAGPPATQLNAIRQAMCDVCWERMVQNQFFGRPKSPFAYHIGSPDLTRPETGGDMRQCKC